MRSLRLATRDSASQLARPAYQDDNYLVGKISAIANVWPNMRKYLAEAGHELNLSKSEIWLPGCDDITDANLPASARHICSDIRRSIGGIKVMGSAAQGQFESMLGPMQLAAQPAGERLQKSISLGERLRLYIEGSQDDTKRHVAWCLLTKCIKEALSYDIRTLPLDIMKPLLEQHAALLRDGVAAVLGREVTTEQWRQIQLPGPLGGFGVRLPLASADAAYVATYFSTADRVKALCVALGKPTRVDTGRREMENALERLRQSGVRVDTQGAVNFTEAARLTYESGPWHHDITVKELLDHQVRRTGPPQGQGSRMHSRIMRAIEALEATAHFQGLQSNHLRELTLAAGGRMTGKSWTAAPQSKARFWDDDHFLCAAAMRMGALEAPAGTVCQIPKANGDTCLREMSHPVVHPQLCKHGPARLRPHRSLVVKLTKLVQRSGMFADMERAVPSLYRIDAQGKVQETVLDVVASPPAGFSTFTADITVRCPHSERYAGAATTPGRAANDGELEKFERYGDTVSPLSFETYGRLGMRSQQALMRMASVAAETSNSGVTAATLYAKWRLELEQVLLHEQTDITLPCYGTSSGSHTLRRHRQRQCRQHNRSLGEDEPD